MYRFLIIRDIYTYYKHSNFCCEPTMSVNEVLERCRSVLSKHYGSRFKGMVLYGSAVHKQVDPASDIDVLVLLNKPFDYVQELRTIIELLYPIQLESEHLISTKPVLEDEFRRGTIQLYRNAKSEGVLL